MTIKGIKDNVQAILNGTNYFVSVLAHAPEEDSAFDGYPSAAHYYQSTESDYATVSQNRRVITYNVDLVLVANTDTDPATELEEMYTLVDNVLQVFDESIDLSDSGLGLSPACDILRPVPGSIERINTNEGVGYICTVRLLCEADVSFTS